MRLSFFASAPVVAVLVLAFACSTNTVHVGGNPDIPEGGMQLDDGAVVDMDGNVVTPVDAAKPALVDVTTGAVDGFTSHSNYVLAVPKSYDAAKQYPLVVVIHGDGGDGASMRAYHTVDNESGSDAIVVYPSGSDHTWDLYTLYDTNEDEHYLEALIAAMKAKYSIAQNKVYGVGWSKGGFIVNQFTCRRSTFNAIASHAGGAPFEQAPNTMMDADGYPLCPGSPKVPAFITHGMADPEVQFDSGQFSAKTWAHYDGCNADGALTATTPSPCQSYTACGTGTPVTFCGIPGNGHGIWDGAVAAEWAFFKALP